MLHESNVKIWNLSLMRGNRQAMRLKYLLLSVIMKASLIFNRFTVIATEEIVYFVSFKMTATFTERTKYLSNGWLNYEWSNFLFSNYQRLLDWAFKVRGIFQLEDYDLGDQCAFRNVGKIGM